MKPLTDEERKVLAELGLPAISPRASHVVTELVEAIGAAQRSHLTDGVWFHDKATTQVPQPITAAPKIKNVRVEAGKPVISKALRALADSDDLVVIAYLGGFLVVTDDMDPKR